VPDAVNMDEIGSREEVSKGGGGGRRRLSDLYPAGPLCSPYSSGVIIVLVVVIVVAEALSRILDVVRWMSRTR
jgi:hypothetical protein